MIAVSQPTMTEMNDRHSTVFSFRTSDGYTLSGKIYTAAGKPIGSIVVAGATGVPQGFYKRFASFASEQGFNVLTFDYRGIGESRPGSLKTLDMSFLDWGRYDLAAAIEIMHESGRPLFLVGHSYGGQAPTARDRHTRKRISFEI